MKTVARAALAAPHLLIRLLLLLLLASWGQLAFAHAALLSSSPAQGALLDEAPFAAVLTFDEPVTPLVLKLIEPDGSVRQMREVKPTADGLSLILPPLRQRGTHVLSWRVVSADGHPVGGSVTFSLGEIGASPVPGQAGPPAQNFWLWLTLALWYAALIAGVGLAGARLLDDAPAVGRGPACALLALAAAATLLNLGLLGVDALNLPLGGLLQRQSWRTAIATSLGPSALLALLALACAAVARWRQPAGGKGAALAAFVLLGAALAASGHAGTAPPAWLARPTVWLHVAAVTFWIGTLAPLFCALRRPDGAAILLGRFSRAIPYALLALVASGVVLTCLQLDTPASLWRTPYGRVLIVKLSLVALLLLLGAYNRYRLTAAVLTARSGARRALCRSVLAEGIIALVILSTVALWRFTPPPRTLAVPGAVSEHVHGPQAMADLTYRQSPHGGAATLSLLLMAPDLDVLPAREVDVVFFNEAAGIEPIRYHARRAEDGSWQVRDLRLPARDRWDVRIEILISDFERIRLDAELRPG